MVYENQDGYYHALRLADKANDSTVFVEFMLDMIDKTLDKYSNAHAQMSDKTSGKEREMFAKVYEYLQNNQHITSEQAQILLGKSPATVRRYLSNWTKYGILEAVGHNKLRVHHLKVC